jgi:hypothetical protein
MRKHHFVNNTYPALRCASAGIADFPANFQNLLRGRVVERYKIVDKEHREPATEEASCSRNPAAGAGLEWNASFIEPLRNWARQASREED